MSAAAWPAVRQGRDHKNETQKVEQAEKALSQTDLGLIQCEILQALSALWDVNISIYKKEKKTYPIGYRGIKQIMHLKSSRVPGEH